MKDRIGGVILAGGRSLRMGGGDKGLALLAGRPLLAHVIGRLRPQVNALALNTNSEPARLASFGLEIVADSLPGLGPLGGVLAGMRWAKQRGNVERIVTVACDTPFFPAELVARLADAVGSDDRIVQARSGDRRHPTFALWPVSLADDLQTFLRCAGSHSMRAFAGERHPVALVDFPLGAGHDPFFNVNTPQDLLMAEQQLAESGR
nr:molybdenum cofactor guanylyltransferase MobA [Chelativorans sp. Marseille-P2723]